MMEEPTRDNIIDLIKKLPVDLSNVESLIVTNEGTVQTLLSVLFKVPVGVEVLSQYTLADKTIVRWSKLVADGRTVCLAESVIKSDNEGFITGITEQKMGIGQLIAAKELQTRRRILGFHTDKELFSRNYIIEDVGMTPKGGYLSIVITEVFLFRM